MFNCAHNSQVHAFSSQFFILPFLIFFMYGAHRTRRARLKEKEAISLKVALFRILKQQHHLSRLRMRSRFMFKQLRPLLCGASLKLHLRNNLYEPFQSLNIWAVERRGFINRMNSPADASRTPLPLQIEPFLWILPVGSSNSNAFPATTSCGDLCQFRVTTEKRKTLVRDWVTSGMRNEMQ